jgi:hypothetical protein
LPIPIAIFTYNRPGHTERLLNSLKLNPVDKGYLIFIYCDGAKKTEHLDSVKETRRIVKANMPNGAKIIERDENFGLAKSIITGVTDLCNQYGKVIVLEDDLVLSPYTLDYFNAALDKYENIDRVMHISAYMYPVKTSLKDSFFYREATCWGWATWQSAWEHFESDAEKLVNEIDNKNKRYEFNINESAYFYQMLCKQRDGEIDSWAIRWYASMFLKNGLALHPGSSLIENLGFDGTGVHCNIDSRFVVELSKKPVNDYAEQVEESEAVKHAMIKYRNSSAKKTHPFRGRIKLLKNKIKSILNK